MELKQLVGQWFETWAGGNYSEIPVTDGFVHTSPFGTVEGKDRYLAMVRASEEQFLGFQFDVHDEFHDDRRACVRYTARKGDFALEASEWFFGSGDGIEKIVSYYNVGQVSYPEVDPED